MDRNRIAEITKKVVLIAQEAGVTIMKYYKEIDKYNIEYKSNNQDVVTEIDRLVETEIARKLMMLTPDAQIIGEEMGYQINPSPIKWVIDPIDGTRYFSRGLPMFSTVIGMAYNDEPFIGVVNVPLTQQTYYGFKGGGSYLDGKLLRLSNLSNLSQAIIYVDIDKIQDLKTEERKWVEGKIVDLLRSCYRVRMFGSSSIAATHLVSGAVNGFIDITGCNPVWDMIPSHVIMTEAGAAAKSIQTRWERARYVAAQPSLLNLITNLVQS